MTAEAMIIYAYMVAVAVQLLAFAGMCLWLVFTGEDDGDE